MRYFVAPNGTGISTNHWMTGFTPGDLATTVNNNPALAPGDEIWVLGDNNLFGVGGTYNLTAPLQISVPNLSIYGVFLGNETAPSGRNLRIDSTQYPTFFYNPITSFPNPSILDGGNANRVIDINADDCRIDGFVIAHGNAGTADGGGIHVSSSNNIRLENLVIMENTAGNRGGGLYLFQGFGNLMNIIFFKNNARDGGGLYLDNTQDVVSRNLLFNENTVNGTAANGNAIYAHNSNVPMFINNTIANNLYPNAASVYCDNSNVGFSNSILFPDNLVAVGGNVMVDYCLLGSMPIGIPLANITNSITGTNPNFVNPLPLSLGGIYRLQQGSPCVNTGNNSYASGIAFDLEGIIPRIVNGTVDMGAFEVP